MLKLKLFKALPSSLKDKYSALEKEAYASKQTLEKKAEHEDKYCSKKDIFSCLVAFEDGEIIGATKLVKRKLKNSDGLLTLGGFGGVWTRKDKRRKGIATAILKQGMKVLKSKGCDIAYLCTDVDNLKDLYSKVGFVALGKNYTFVGKSGKRYFENDGMIAPVNSEKKFKQILKDKKPLDIGVGNW